jgi:hypothetical protein
MKIAAEASRPYTSIDQLKNLKNTPDQPAKNHQEHHMFFI